MKQDDTSRTIDKLEKEARRHVVEEKREEGGGQSECKGKIEKSTRY